MTRASTLADNASIMSQPAGTAPGYMARAWVNFNGTGTVAIRASGNVTSITDLGTGYYRVNFTNIFTDANYSVSFGGQSVSASGWWRFLGSGAVSLSGFSSSSYTFETPAANFTPADTEIATLSFFR